MKKYFDKVFYLFAILLAFTAGFCGINSLTNLNTVNANSNSTYTNILPADASVVISQDGYKFGLNDFEISQTENADGQTITNYTLFVNTGVTINKTSTSSNLLISHSKNNGELSRDVIYGNGYFYIDYEEDIQNTHSITLQLQINGIDYGNSFKFTLVQTSNRFSVNPSFYWTDDSGTEITAPTSAGTYKQIQLNNLIGTKECPVFADFYFNGEYYSIYTNNDTGIYYNRLTGNRLSSSELIFDTPGQYKIEIYDKTNLTNSSYKNNQSFSFEIKKPLVSGVPTLENLYIIANDETGNTIVDGQVINGSVFLKFYNIDPRIVNKVIIEQFRDDLLASDHIQIITERTDITQVGLQTFEFSEDSIYDIYLMYGSSTVYSFNFRILNEVHNSYKETTSDDLTENEIVTLPQSDTFETNYAGFSEITDKGVSQLKSYTTTHYEVQLARANTRIEGIENDASVTGSVTAKAYGVGQITVTVTKDGSTSTYTLSNGQTIPNTSGVGKYTIHIQDQMGFTVTCSFKINRSLNSATIILIVVGVVAIVLASFIIIRMRTKIKVR